MRSTMMDMPLTIASIMRYGTSIFGNREVVTCTEDGSRRRTYAEAGRRAARLANALRRLGVDADQRVGTFMWNNAEHLEAYLAIPSMGAVLHTLNIRLAPAEVGYIATHAEDHAVIVDASLVPKFAEILPHASTVKHVIVSGAPLGETPGADELTGASVHSYEELLAAEPDSYDWPALDEFSAAAMCYTSGTTGHPKGVVYSHRSSYLHSMGACIGNAFAISDRDRVLPVVPMFHANAWGLAYAGLLSGAALILPNDGEAVGEVEVRGPWITGSYYKDDDPAKFHDGWLRTGDVGTLDPGGYIQLTDRAKDVIKSGGEWISSMELENILMAHPDVAEAAVIGVADEKWGERPLAAIVLRGGADVTAGKLWAFLAEQVPRWQLPERWCFIPEVPKTSVGKFSKRAMRAAYQAGDYEIIEIR